MIYDCDFFIQKFSAIPDEFWCVGEYSKGSKHCAYGHCGVTFDNVGNFVSAEANAFYYLAKEYSSQFALINDGQHPNYQQQTAKERIIAALKDIKKLQQKHSQPSYPNISKQLAILPKEETPDLIIQIVN